jgi:putative DNA primase/helicase
MTTRENVASELRPVVIFPDGQQEQDGYQGPEDFVRTDVNNSNQLVARYGAVLRWVPKWRAWLHYDGIRWATVSEDEVIGFAKHVLYELREEANQLTLSRETRDIGLERLSWAVSSEKGQHLELMVNYAKPDLVARPEDFDRNPDLFNVLDGTFDFSTGELREHRAGDMITKLAPVAYRDGTDGYRLWAKFIDDITDGDVSLAVYIQ